MIPGVLPQEGAEARPAPDLVISRDRKKPGFDTYGRDHNDPLNPGLAFLPVGSATAQDNASRLCLCR